MRSRKAETTERMRTMTIRFRGALLTAGMLALPIVASAQPVTSLYVGAGGGVNPLPNEHVKSVYSGGVEYFLDVDLGSRVGPAAVLDVGRGLGNGLRFEVEGDYRANKFDWLTSGRSTVAAAGDLQQKGGAMENLLAHRPWRT